MSSVRLAKATLPVTPLSVSERCEERRHRSRRAASAAGTEPGRRSSREADGAALKSVTIDAADSRASSVTTRCTATSYTDTVSLARQVESLKASMAAKDRELAAKDQQLL